MAVHAGAARPRTGQAGAADHLGQGGTRPGLAGTLAHVLLASVNEVALPVARADDEQTAMRDGAEAIDELLRRLFS